MSPTARGGVRSTTEAGESDSQGDNRVHPVHLGQINIYLIESETGHILVDAGIPKSEEALDGTFIEAGVDPSSVQLIIATHGHLDHIGSMARTQRATGAEVLCHRSFASRFANGEVEPALPQNLKGRILNLMTTLTRFTYGAVEPDITMDKEFALSEYGLAGRFLHTPGHSPSSVSVMLENGEALIESLEKMAACEPRTIFLSHGTHVDVGTPKDVIEASR